MVTEIKSASDSILHEYLKRIRQKKQHLVEIKFVIHIPDLLDELMQLSLK